MTYVALLRGINVGGNNKVEMARLKEVFQRAGMQAVATYINSGNVVFRNADEASPAVLAATLEKGIREEFSLDIPVLLVDSPSFKNIAARLPASWQNDTETKADCLFLWPSADVSQAPVPKPSIDEVIAVPGALLWRTARKDLGRSAMPGMIGTAFYRQVTVRNINTVRKLWERLEATDRQHND